MSFFGILNGVFTVFFFSRMSDYFGVKGVYLIGTAAAVPCFALFPLISYLARNSFERSGSVGAGVWVAVGIQVALSVLVCLCYGTSVCFPVFHTHLCAHFRRSVYFHRCSHTKQGISGSYKWARTSVCVHRACGWSRPCEFGVLVVN
jgi:hypothetical protein